jgi:hypothetical protein
MKANQWLPRRLIDISAFLVMLITAGMTIAPAQAAAVKIIAVDDNAYGNTYGEWSARWWQWLLSIPAATNPNLDTTGANCTQQQSGPVFFLAGAFGGFVIRKCSVPAETALFFPISNVLAGAAVFDCEPTEPGVTCNLAVLRSAAAAGQSPVTLKAIIDGKPVKDLNQQRVQSPVLTITYPDESVTGVPGGTYAPNVSDGYWLLLAPLSAGTHTIYFKSGDFLEVTYNLTVQQ